MIILRAAVILVGCFIIAVGIRCTNCKCNEITTKTVYRLANAAIAHLSFSEQDTISLINSLTEKNTYAMRVDITANSSEMIARGCQATSLFITEALSCDCPLPDVVPAHKVKSIKIIHLKGTDESDSGQDITHQFKYNIAFKKSGIKEKYTSVDEFVLNYFPYPDRNSYSVNGPLHRSFVLFLKNAVLPSGAHRFKIIITMDDQSVIEQASSIVIVV